MGHYTNPISLLNPKRSKHCSEHLNFCITIRLDLQIFLLFSFKVLDSSILYETCKYNYKGFSELLFYAIRITTYAQKIEVVKDGMNRNPFSFTMNLNQISKSILTFNLTIGTISLIQTFSAISVHRCYHLGISTSQIISILYLKFSIMLINT